MSKRPTHVFCKIGETYGVAEIKMNYLVKFLIRYGMFDVTFTTGELPSFWGQYRCLIYNEMKDTLVKAFRFDVAEYLAGTAMVVHPEMFSIVTVEHDEDSVFLEWVAKLEPKEIIWMLEILAPHRIPDYKAFIKQQRAWRRTMTNKEVCMFDNMRECEDEGWL